MSAPPSISTSRANDAPGDWRREWLTVVALVSMLFFKEGAPMARVLLAADAEPVSNRVVARLALEEAGHEVHEVHDGF
jgi:hypothetical protein